MTLDNDLLWIRIFITSRDNFSEDIDLVQIMFYDHQGSFIKSIQVFEEESGDFALHPQNGDYYFFNTLLPNMIQRVDGTSVKVKISFFKSDEPPIRTSFNSFFVTCQASLLFRNFRTQGVYEIEEDTAMLKYKFDYGDQYPD